MHLPTGLRHLPTGASCPIAALLDAGPAPLPAGLRLRPARDADAGAIIAFMSGIWAAYPDKVLDAEADMPELLAPASAYAARDGRFWVAEDAAGTAGTVAVIPGSQAGLVELQKLYVRPDLRRLGLGAFLCGLVEQEARRRGRTGVELWTDTKFVQAHRLYESLGYRRDDAPRVFADSRATIRWRFVRSFASC